LLDYLSLAFDIVGFVISLGMAYYAFCMINQMKTGRLEKSWKYMTRGALIIAIDAVVLMIQVFGSSSALIVEGTTYTGATFAIIGGFLIMLGFRENYRVWNTKIPVSKNKSNKNDDNGKKKLRQPALVPQSIRN
jgi:protein-S-isoprenylcysteine O-methyltransferase Ste14